MAFTFCLLILSKTYTVPAEGPVITGIVRKAANCSSPDLSPVIISWKVRYNNHVVGYFVLLKF